MKNFHIERVHFTLRDSFFLVSFVKHVHLFNQGIIAEAKQVSREYREKSLRVNEPID